VAGVLQDQMCTMCHFCGAELRRSDEDKKKLETRNSLKCCNGGLIMSCKFCGERQGRRDVKLDGLSPYATPMISPTTSLSSSDSYVSSCSKFLFSCYCFYFSFQSEEHAHFLFFALSGDFSVDVNSYDRCVTPATELCCFW
jgi:hypothetical protein